MCLICVEFQQGRLTITEARRNLSEMVESLEPDHAEEVEELLQEAVDAAEEDPAHNID